jgi:hypothetical protein
MAEWSPPALDDERRLSTRLTTLRFKPRRRRTTVTLTRSQRSSTCRSLDLLSEQFGRSTALEDAVGDSLVRLPCHASDPIAARTRALDCPCPGLAGRVVGGCTDDAELTTLARKPLIRVFVYRPLRRTRTIFAVERPLPGASNIAWRISSKGRQVLAFKSPYTN